jgi:hypothetical protein
MHPLQTVQLHAAKSKLLILLCFIARCFFLPFRLELRKSVLILSLEEGGKTAGLKEIDGYLCLSLIVLSGSSRLYASKKGTRGCFARAS